MSEPKKEYQEKSVEEVLESEEIKVEEKKAEEEKKSEEIEKDIKSYKNELTKKFKFIEAIAIIPKQASKIIEEEYEVPKTESKKGLIHILVLIPDNQIKNIAKIKLESIKIAKKINEKFWIHIMLPTDIWGLCLDSKYDIVEALSMSFPIMDKGLLSSLRVSQIHKSLVLKKFEKYVTSYVIYGSITRGEALKTSDVDIGIIIDDTDVKRMPRIELKEKLRSIIYSYIQEAQAIAQTKNILNVQVWLLTEFWEGVKDAHPVFFTFIRDGSPLYDRGTFLPWKSLLRMGKIRPSPEAIDMFMSSGLKLKENVQRRIFDIATLDLFWGISTPTQGLLMLYGLSPSTPKETLKAFKEIFYEKEKLIEKKYVDILEEIFIRIWKGHEHGKIKPGDIDGKELDRLSKNAIDYIERIQKLREQIEKRVNQNSIKETYKNLFEMIGSMLNVKGEKNIISKFNKELIKTGKFPPRYLESLKFIAKINKEEKSKKDLVSLRKDLDKARRLSSEITNHLIEYSQRCEIEKINKSRYTIKGKELSAQVFFLDNIFLVQGNNIKKISNDEVINSNETELQEHLSKNQNKKINISHKDLETLRKIFGEFELIQ